MSDVIGSTIQGVWSSVNTICNTSFVQVVMGVTTDTDIVGLTSDNDGTFRNVSGGAITINGSWHPQLTSGGSDTYIFAPATSEDKITWSPAGIDQWKPWRAFGRWIGNKFSYKITVPNGHYFGIVVKTTIGASTLAVASNAHFVRSDEGTVETPLLDAKCLTYINNNYQQQTISTSFQESNAITLESEGSVGAILINSSRIQNNTGQTITVDGSFFHKNTGAGIISITNRYVPIKNGVAIPATAMETSAGVLSSTHYTFVNSYSVELDDGDYVGLGVRQTAGGFFFNRNWFLQHSMRSRT